jgi:hypothetical protein
MSGKRKLGGGGEDPNPCGVGRIVGRQDEGRLGKIEFPRDGLHERRVDRPGVREDGELISAEHSVRENVYGDERNTHVRKR